MAYKDPDDQRAAQRRWLHKNRQAFFADKSCAKCGSRKRLELDHIDRATKVSHSVWSWKPERRAAELAKCQALCKKCHLNKTRVESIAALQHGETLTLYEKHGCRCAPCKARKSKKNALRYRPRGVVGDAAVL